MLIPTCPEEKYMLYCGHTNGAESIHRNMNRNLREYNNESMSTIGSYLLKFYENQVKTHDELVAGEKKTNTSDYMLVCLLYTKQKYKHVIGYLSRHSPEKCIRRVAKQTCDSQ